ncbi:hypothetical protein GCM10022222_53550 [Amycolatopsis ultiminotia]|uniref:Uncharacterized protein n=1 Tax=Amycolatopsis ultiminotia TaxID=543629 RepID=A0ABP6X926_9PSEU
MARYEKSLAANGFRRPAPGDVLRAERRAGYVGAVAAYSLYAESAWVPWLRAGWRGGSGCRARCPWEVPGDVSEAYTGASASRLRRMAGCRIAARRVAGTGWRIATRRSTWENRWLADVPAFRREGACRGE